MSDIDFNFGITIALNIGPKTPGNRKFKAAVQKFQSSPLKPADNNNISNSYTVVTGKKGKRAAKKNYIESISKVKQSQLNSSSRLNALIQEMEVEILESEIVEFANLISTGLALELARESSLEVFIGGSKKSSLVDFLPILTMVVNTLALKRSTQ